MAWLITTSQGVKHTLLEQNSRNPTGWVRLDKVGFVLDDNCPAGGWGKCPDHVYGRLGSLVAFFRLEELTTFSVSSVCYRLTLTHSLLSETESWCLRKTVPGHIPAGQFWSVLILEVTWNRSIGQGYQISGRWEAVVCHFEAVVPAVCANEAV